jgi:hypothetical protein
MGFKEGMKALGKGIADWAETSTPVELKLSNIGKPVEVRTWVREGPGVANESLTVYAGILKSYAIFSDGFEIVLDDGRKGRKIEAGFKTHRVEVTCN